MAHQPQNLVATPVSSTQINLSWDDVETLDDELYDVERDGVIVESSLAATTFSDTGLSADTEYTYRVRAVGGTEVAIPFVPTDIASLALWADFADAASLFTDTGLTTPVSSDGQIIKGVTDKSGSGIHLTEATNGPTYKTAIQNGLSIARFDGSNDTLTGGDAVGHPFSCIIVSKLGGAVAMTLVAFNAAGNSVLQADWPPNRSMTTYNGSGLTSSDVSDATAFHNRAYLINGASSKLYEDGGTAGASGDAGSNNPDSVRLSVYPTSAWYAQDIAELLLFDTVLSLTDLNLLGTYLADKWGISWTTAT